jgi:hypothetical protein
MLRSGKSNAVAGDGTASHILCEEGLTPMTGRTTPPFREGVSINANGVADGLYAFDGEAVAVS